MTQERRVNNSEWPVWLLQAWQKDPTEEGSLFHSEHLDSDGNDLLLIKTLEGTQLVSWGDFIIKGVQGEIYPCKPDIFEETYEPVI